jgi:hypothetical protein
MARSRKNRWWENNGLQHKKRRETEGSKNEEKKITVIKINNTKLKREKNTKIKIKIKK